MLGLVIYKKEEIALFARLDDDVSMKIEPQIKLTRLLIFERNGRAVEMKRTAAEVEPRPIFSDF